jgi:hypothetical protein
MGCRGLVRSVTCVYLSQCFRGHGRRDGTVRDTDPDVFSYGTQSWVAVLTASSIPDDGRIALAGSAEQEFGGNLWPTPNAGGFPSVFHGGRE